MVIASHVIFGTYGFWLPNDPRGSWSQWVAAWELFRHGGPATKTNTRRSVAAAKHNSAARQAMKQHLKYPPVRLTGEQAREAALAFGEFAADTGICIHAAAIMPEHIHLVVARHHYHAEQVANLLKGAATKRLRAKGLDPFPLDIRHSPWSASLWKVFLNDAADVRRSIRYVEQNPMREGLRSQRWSCVTPYTPAPLGPG